MVITEIKFDSVKEGEKTILTLLKNANVKQVEFETDTRYIDFLYTQGGRIKTLRTLGAFNKGCTEGACALESVLRNLGFQPKKAILVYTTDVAKISRWKMVACQRILVGHYFFFTNFHFFKSQLFSSVKKLYILIVILKWRANIFFHFGISA